MPSPASCSSAYGCFSSAASRERASRRSRSIGRPALMGINLSRVTALSFAGERARPGWPACSCRERLGATTDGSAAGDPGIHRPRDRRVGRVEGRCSGACLLAFASSSRCRYAPPGGLCAGVPLLLLMMFLLCARPVAAREMTSLLRWWARAAARRRGVFLSDYHKTFTASFFCG